MRRRAANTSAKVGTSMPPAYHHRARPTSVNRSLLVTRGHPRGGRFRRHRRRSRSDLPLPSDQRVIVELRSGPPLGLLLEFPVWSPMSALGGYPCDTEVVTSPPWPRSPPPPR